MIAAGDLVAGDKVMREADGTVGRRGEATIAVQAMWACARSVVGCRDCDCAVRFETARRLGRPPEAILCLDVARMMQTRSTHYRG